MKTERITPTPGRGSGMPMVEGDCESTRHGFQKLFYRPQVQ